MIDSEIKIAPETEIKSVFGKAINFFQLAGEISNNHLSTQTQLAEALNFYVESLRMLFKIEHEAGAQAQLPLVLFHYGIACERIDSLITSTSSITEPTTKKFSFYLIHARELYQQALSYITDETEEAGFVVTLLCSIGKISVANQEHQRARIALNKALTVVNTINEKTSRLVSLYKLVGDSFQSIGENKIAEDLFSKSAKMLQTIALSQLTRSAKR